MNRANPDTPHRVVESVFKKYDQNTNLKIELQEFQSLCYDLGYWLSEYEAKVIFGELDKDNKGEVDYDTLERWWRTNDKFRKLDESKTDLYQSCITYFRFFDQDDGGTITREEYMQLHKDLQSNGQFTKLTAEDGLKLLDENGDGVIQFNEFMDFLDRVAHS